MSTKHGETSLIMMDDIPNQQFVKQITKHSKNNLSQASAVSNTSKRYGKSVSINFEKKSLTKKTTFKGIINLPSLITKTHSFLACSAIRDINSEGCRIDFFGNKIVKRGKRHKIVFIDHTIDGGTLADVIDIESNKKVDAATDKNNTSNNKGNNSLKGDNENCSCLCLVF